MDTETKCAHHWRIEAPNGPTSPGVCRKCGAKKKFVNYADHPLGANSLREASERGWW
jgi:hypothetical protein